MKIIDSHPRRVVLTIPYEWGPILDCIKKDKFFNASRSDMLRYILNRGLDSIKDEQSQNKAPEIEIKE